MRVKCPKCGKTLFDFKYLDGDMEIKCPKCKKITPMAFVRVTASGDADPPPEPPSDTGEQPARNAELITTE